MRNYPEHVHNIARLELIETINQIDERGQLIIPTVDDAPANLTDLAAEMFESMEAEQRAEFARQDVGVCDSIAGSAPDPLKFAEIWPLMGIHSQDTKHGGAWRLSVLFKALDPNGSGKIERAQLESVAIEQMKVKRSTFFNWLADAKKAGIFSTSKGKDDYLYLASQEKQAAIYLCNSIDRRKVVIPLKLLFRPGWKKIVFAAYIKANHHAKIGYTNKMQAVYRGNVVSEKTIEQVTGIQPRQQRRLSDHVNRKRQYSVTTIPGSWEQAEALNKSAKDHGKRRHYFTFNDPAQEDPNHKRQYRRVIAYTIPSRRSVSDYHATIAARGRRRKILNSLRLVLLQSSVISARPQQAGTLTEGYTEFERLYLETSKQQERQASGYIPRVGRFGRFRPVWDEYQAPQWTHD